PGRRPSMAVLHQSASHPRAEFRDSGMPAPSPDAELRSLASQSFARALKTATPPRARVPAPTTSDPLPPHAALRRRPDRPRGRARVGPRDSVLPVPSSGAVRFMAGPDVHGAQSAEQRNTVDSLHSPPFPAPHGARQGDPGPVRRVIPGGGRHDRPVTRPTDRS